MLKKIWTHLMRDKMIAPLMWMCMASSMCMAGEDVHNHYFDATGAYVMTTEAYAEATPPPDALRIAPDFAEGRWPVINATGDGWELVPDHRGKEGYIDGEPAKITALGPLPDGWSDAPPPRVLTLDEAKSAKKSAIDANTNRIRDRDGLAYAGERFAMSDTAQVKWTGLMAAKDILPYPLTILTIDDKPFVIADNVELLGFLVAVMGYETAPASPLSTGRVLRQAVEMARTVEEVEAVVDDRD